MCCDVHQFVFLFFFFKQKTAYEMRISDWSSDVCSSDLCLRRWPIRTPIVAGSRPGAISKASRWSKGSAAPIRMSRSCCHAKNARSEEHTSELQSLMRISYAVFGLQKKHVRLDCLHHRLSSIGRVVTATCPPQNRTSNHL